MIWGQSDKGLDALTLLGGGGVKKLKNEKKNHFLLFYGIWGSKVLNFLVTFIIGHLMVHGRMEYTRPYNIIWGTETVNLCSCAILVVNHLNGINWKCLRFLYWLNQPRRNFRKRNVLCLIPGYLHVLVRRKYSFLPLRLLLSPPWLHDQESSAEPWAEGEGGQEGRGIGSRPCGRQTWRTKTILSPSKPRILFPITQLLIDSSQSASKQLKHHNIWTIPYTILHIPPLVLRSASPNGFFESKVQLDTLPEIL